MRFFEGWVKYLPRAVRQRVEGRENLWRILDNASWLFADRVLRLGVGLLVFVWVARYLGPADFGLLSCVVAFVSLVLPLAMLGLDSIVVRDLVQHPGRADETLGTAFVLKLVAGCSTFALALLLVITLKPQEYALHLMVGLVGVGLILQAFDTVDLWFQSQVRSKYTVVARNTSSLGISVMRLVLVLTAAPLVAFAGAFAVEALLSAVGLVVVYQWSGQAFRRWRSSSTRALELLRTSWPLILSGLAIVIYMRIAQVMLGEMSNDVQVGIFAAAVRVSEVWYFVPSVVVSSVAPSLINARKTDPTLYSRRIQQLLGVMAVLGYCAAIPVSLLSDLTVRWLFGVQYAAAAPVLTIHIWAGMFVCLGMAQSAWLVNEDRTGLILAGSASGAVLNVVFSYFLIPRQGALGAALATLISYGLSVTVLSFFHPATRTFGRMLLGALFLLPLFNRKLRLTRHHAGIPFTQQTEDVIV